TDYAVGPGASASNPAFDYQGTTHRLGYYDYFTKTPPAYVPLADNAVSGLSPIIHHNLDPLGNPVAQSITSIRLGSNASQDTSARPLEALYGKLDDLRIYDRALNAEEVLDLMTPADPETRSGGLVHHWPFDLDTRDHVGFNDGVFYLSDPEGDDDTPQEGVFGNGVVNQQLTFSRGEQLDGGQHLDVGDISLPGDQATVLMWVNINRATLGVPGTGDETRQTLIGTRPAIDGAPGWRLYVRDDLSLQLETVAEGVAGGPVVAQLPANVFIPDSWIHVGVIFDLETDRVRFFCNGFEIDLDDQNEQIADGLELSGRLWIGNDPGKTSPLHGALDEVLIFDHAVPAETIQDIGRESGLELNEDIYSDLLVHWRFDETTAFAGGTVSDSSGNNRSGFLGGNPGDANPQSVPTVLTAGVIGHARIFDGDDFVIEPNAEAYLNFQTALTAAGWVRMPTDAAPSDTVWIAGGQPGAGEDALSLGIDAQGRPFARLRLADGRYLTAVAEGVVLDPPGTDADTDEAWYHLAFTWEAGQPLQLYVDGQERGLSGASSLETWVSGVQELIVGRGTNAQGVNSSWVGNLDDVRLYGRALSPGQVRLLASLPYLDESQLPVILKLPDETLPPAWQYLPALTDLTYDKIGDYLPQAGDELSSTFFDSPELIVAPDSIFTNRLGFSLKGLDIDQMLEARLVMVPMGGQLVQDDSQPSGYRYPDFFVYTSGNRNWHDGSPNPAGVPAWHTDSGYVAPWHNAAFAEHYPSIPNADGDSGPVTEIRLFEASPIIPGWVKDVWWHLP
ncbi:MAG: LamG domain-containing protein, partial [Planctomycetota bacterium]